MDNIIYLCSIPFLDNSYTNVIDFESLSSQNAYFDSKSTKRIKGNIITDGEREQFTLNLTFQELKAYDYLYMIDPVTLKRYYYFITNKSYKTSTSSIVDVELDVYSTYLFDHQLLHSFVDRCHVPRWNGSIPSKEIVDEGLPVHDYIITGKEKIAEFNSSYLITATEPLGVLKDAVYNPDSGNSGGNSTVSGTVIGNGTAKTTGVITRQGFRFIKGYEAFTPTGACLSGETFRTVGYGSTEKYNLDYFNQHQPFPCTEQLASEIYATRIKNEFGNGIKSALSEAGVLDKVTYNMFDAMCSLAYNRGLSGFLNDSTSPFKLVIKNPTDYINIKNTWHRYATTSSDTGQVLQGLVNRRIAEAAIYCNHTYEMRSIGVYNVDGKLSGTVTDNNGNGFIPSTLPDATSL